MKREKEEDKPRGHRDIIVVGASAGGIEAFSMLIRDLPANFPATIFFVVHIPASKPSHLPEILSRTTRMTVMSEIKDGQSIRPGRIYIAPPDFHLILESGSIRLVRGPKERWYRPAIDLLFSSAAKSYGARVIGIILSGVLEDGVTGLSAIKACGGITMVQAPEDALHPEMPHNALKKVKVDYSLPVAQISAQLLNLVQKHDSGSANSGSK